MDSREIPIQIVKFNGSIVSHFCKIPDFELNVGSIVTLKVNSKDRLLHSALHTAGHLIFSIVKTITRDLVEKKGHHYPLGSYVEFTGTWDGDLQEFQSLLKDAIQNDSKIFVYSKDGKRFVQIQGFPECGCGGTHLESLGILKGIDIKKITVKKGITRISYSIQL